MAFPLTNRLLETLPNEFQASMARRLEAVAMPTGTVLFEANSKPKYVHLMTSGMASVVTAMGDGSEVEVGLCGREGSPECIHLLGPETGSKRCFMQLEGTALRMPFKRFDDEFRSNSALQLLVLRFVQSESLLLGQLAACNRLHNVEERLARWLLMVQDRIGEPILNLTQDFLGQMLGTRRSSVTLAAGSLQRAGLIEYRRGDIRIINREALEDAACECYGVARQLFEGLYH